MNSPARADHDPLDQLKILGVELYDLTTFEALRVLSEVLDEPQPHARSLYFVNAHTLNTATENPAYREALNRSDFVFGDGTGVRWAAKLQGIQIKDNLNGTDLIPRLLMHRAGHGYRYYLLGSSEDHVTRAAEAARQMFPLWECAGFHHGFLDQHNTPAVIDEINQLEPHLLLVAMGNPLQELWIDRHREQLNVRLCAGVGALVDRWAGELIRAPLWMRKLGMEWLDILFKQPHKWQRYLLGNPLFLYRIAVERLKMGRLLRLIGSTSEA